MKRIIALTLALTLLLCGCGGKKAETPKAEVTLPPCSHSGGDHTGCHRSHHGTHYRPYRTAHLPQPPERRDRGRALQRPDLCQHHQQHER